MVESRSHASNNFSFIINSAFDVWGFNLCQQVGWLWIACKVQGSLCILDWWWENVNISLKKPHLGCKEKPGYFKMKRNRWQKIPLSDVFRKISYFMKNMDNITFVLPIAILCTISNYFYIRTQYPYIRYHKIIKKATAN